MKARLYRSGNLLIAVFGQLNLLWKGEKVNQQILCQQTHLLQIILRRLVKTVNAVISEFLDIVSPLLKRVRNNTQFMKFFDTAMKPESLNIRGQVAQSQLQTFAQIPRCGIQPFISNVLFSFEEQFCNAAGQMFRYIWLRKFRPRIQYPNSDSLLQSRISRITRIESVLSIGVDREKNAFPTSCTCVCSEAFITRARKIKRHHTAVSEMAASGEAMRAIVFKGQHCG